MASLKIEKRISLGFLGDKYKEDYFLFNAMPVREFKTVSKSLEAVEKDNEKSLDVLVQLLKDKFAGGKFAGEDLTKENIDDLDLPAITKIFVVLTGQDDPKGVK